MIFRSKVLFGVLVCAIVGFVAWAVVSIALKKEAPANVVKAVSVMPEEAGSEVKPIQTWTKRCDKKNEKQCEVFQRLIFKKNNVRLLEVALTPLEDGGARIGVILPLGILVSKGIAIQVDAQPAQGVSVRSCVQAGCIALANLSKDFMTIMKEGQAFNVAFFDGQEKPVKIRLSLTGLSEKFTEIQ